MVRFIAALAAVTVLVSCQKGEDYETTYVIPAVLNVRQGPSTQHPVITQVQRGQELRIVSQQDPWMRVLLSDDSPGWVHGDYVGEPAAVRAALREDLRSNRSAPQRRRSTTAPRAGELTIDGLLDDLPGRIPTEQLPPVEGVDRVMGATRDGQVVVEFWGDENDLDRALMMVTVLDLPEADLEGNATYALAFVKSALPGLDRDLDWMVRRLERISSGDAGSGELKSARRTVSFEFLKSLGAVRVTVEPAEE